MIFFSPNLLKLFQYYPEKQSIFILFPPYFHLISIHSPFIVRSSFVICSSHFSVTTLPLLGRGLGRGYFVRLFFIYPFGSHRLLFVHSPFILRLFSIHSSSARAARTVLCSFIVRLLFVLCSFFVRSLFVLCSFARAARTVFCSS